MTTAVEAGAADTSMVEGGAAEITTELLSLHFSHNFVSFCFSPYTFTIYYLHHI